MAEDCKKIRISELPLNTNIITDDNMFITDNGSTTNKITGKELANYIKDNSVVSGYYVHQDSIGKPNGVPSLDSNTKLLSENIPFGTISGSVFEGSAGKTLENSINSEIIRAKAAEEANENAIAAEVIRAKGEEKTNADAISAEITRSKAAEQANAQAVTAEAARAKAAEKQNADAIGLHVNSVDAEIKALQETDAALELKKANAAEVNAALDARYTKDQTYSRQEVLGKIEELIGTAPDTLDTFKEIADALGNDPNFATTIMNALAGKVDKADGKGLSSNDYSSAEKDKVQTAYNVCHSHGNKTVLDKITQILLDNWTDAYNKRHEHGNKGVLDGITAELIAAWNNAVTHVSDAIKHITVTERTNWNDANNKKHIHDNKGVLDTITQTLLAKWNNVENKVDKISGKGLSTNDYTTVEKQKLANIAAKAEINVQSDWLVTDDASDSYIKNKPSTYPPSSHTHTKSQISDMPTKISQFTNDKGYITTADIDISQNHAHTNKEILDAISTTNINNWNTITNKVDKISGKGLSTIDFTPTLLTKLNGIADEANKYVHPATSGNKHIPSGGSAGQILRWSADGTATWGIDNNTTYGNMKGATASAAGASGLVPAPTAGKQGQFLKGDGTWGTPTNTTYNVATASTNGLMSTEDKKNLDTIISSSQEKTSDTEPIGQKVGDFWLQEYT